MPPLSPSAGALRVQIQAARLEADPIDGKAAATGVRINAGSGCRHASNVTSALGAAPARSR